MEEQEELASINGSTLPNSGQDSMKILPLRLSVSVEEQTDVNTADLCITPVPVDWEFNDLLTNISKEMSAADLAEMKSRVKGAGGIGRMALETVKSGVELFDVFQKHNFIDRDNVLLLQALLHRMNKDKLFDLAVQYAQSSGNAIHFKPPPKEPPNGYRYAQIHVDGRNFIQYKRSSLEALRAHAARLMFVKPELVVIAGIEPSSSMLITLMIPDKFIKYLVIAADNSECIMEWIHFGVDFVRIDGDTYNLSEAKPVVSDEAEDQQRWITTFQQYEDMKQRLDKTEAENLDLKRALQKQSPVDTVHISIEEDLPSKRNSDVFGRNDFHNAVLNQQDKQMMISTKIINTSLEKV